MTRSYTVAEIDHLRRCCESRLIWGSYSGPAPMPGGGLSGGSGGNSAPYNSAEVSRRAEDMVRTHMMAGHVAADLIGSR